MQRRTLASLMRFGVCAALVLGTVAAQAADITGTWTWAAPARGGRRGGGGGGFGGPAGGDTNAAPATPPPAPQITAKLKAEGTKLTGTVTFPAGRGGDATDVAISDGKIDGAKISFNVVRDFNGNSITNSYDGVLDGDTIKGTQPGGRGGRRGGGGGFGGPGGPGAGGPPPGGGAPGGPGAGGPGAGGPPPAAARVDWTATRSK